MGNIVLRPGTPDDDNRDYLPEKIKGSDIVVNENGNNSIPYPERLEEFHGDIVGDGTEDEWYVYVPESYDPKKKTPLVLSMHGGMMTGWGQCIYTSWSMMADRDGFIVVFPNAGYNRFWTVPWGYWRADKEPTGLMEGTPPGVAAAPENPAENHDVKLALALIERIKEEYNIDEGRIFMQGMSMGNMMTAQFARSFGHVLAGAAGSGAAAFLSLIFDEKEEKLKNTGGPLAIWQSRPEKNDIPPRGPLETKVHKMNRLYWARINECDLIPEITIKGDNNLAFYKGKKADLVYLDIKNRDHGQTLDDASLVWDYLFSGIRREPDGSIVRIPSVKERKGDKFAIAVTKGSDKAWLYGEITTMATKARDWKKMKYHGLEGGSKVRGEYTMVPLSFLAKAFNCELNYSHDRLSAVMTTPAGEKLQFARGLILCVIDNCPIQMYIETIERDGELNVSLEWFSEYLFNMHVSTCDDVTYVTDHVNNLSANMADLIKDLLTDNIAPENYEGWM